MKLDKHIPESDKIEIVQSEVNQKQVNWSIKNIPKGLTLFEINNDTGDIRPAIFDELADLEFAKVGYARNLKTIKKRVRQHPDCVYIPALNVKNAVKKWYKLIQAQNLVL